MPVIPATQEAETGEWQIQVNLSNLVRGPQQLSKALSQNENNLKGLGGNSLVSAPGFNPQSHEKKII